MFLVPTNSTFEIDRIAQKALQSIPSHKKHKNYYNQQVRTLEFFY